MIISTPQQIKTGLYILNHNELHKILEVYDPPLDCSFGHRLLVAVQTKRNGIQKLSFNTIKGWCIYSKVEDPEVFL